VENQIEPAGFRAMGRPGSEKKNLPTRHGEERGTERNSGEGKGNWHLFL